MLTLVRGIVVVGVGALMALGSVGSRKAQACGNGVEYEIERGVMEVARAEALVNQGNERAAVQNALKAFRKPNRLNPARGGLIARAARIFAVAQVRQMGSLEVPGFDEELGRPASAFQRQAEFGEPILVAVLLARQREQFGESTDLRGMPLGLPALSAEQIQLVETWIAQGRPQ